MFLLIHAGIVSNRGPREVFKSVRVLCTWVSMKYIFAFSIILQHLEGPDFSDLLSTQTTKCLYGMINITVVDDRATHGTTFVTNGLSVCLKHYIYLDKKCVFQNFKKICNAYKSAHRGFLQYPFVLFALKPIKSISVWRVLVTPIPSLKQLTMYTVYIFDNCHTFST